jgi:opacity protein-like surface antigen
MKRSGMLFLVVLLSTAAGFSQSNTSLAIITGYTMSAFEGQEDAAGTLPLGLQLGYMAGPNVQVGAEVNNLLGGLTWEAKDTDFTLQTTFNQTIISAYAKFFLGQGHVKPFVKGGLGYFLGDADVVFKYAGEETKDKLKIDPAIGFIVGGGVTLTPKLFLEFNYNIVSRQAADSGSDGFAMEDSANEKSGMNTWSVLVGYKFNL